MAIQFSWMVTSRSSGVRVATGINNMHLVVLRYEHTSSPASRIFLNTFLAFTNFGSLLYQDYIYSINSASKEGMEVEYVF